MTLQPQINLQNWLDKAQSALETGMLAQASQAVQQALSLAPQSDKARLLQARIELAFNRPERALTALDAHDLNHPAHRDKPELTLLRAESLCRAGHTQLAQELLQKMAANFPDDVRPHKLIASVYLILEQPAKAQYHLQQVLRLAPSDDISRRTLAQLLAAESPQAGAAMFETMLAAATAPQLVSLRMARLYHQAGRDRDAEEVYRQLLALEPDDAPLWLEAGQLAEEMGATDLAILRMKHAGKLMGNNARPVLAARALTLMRSGHLASAGRLWWRLLRQCNSDLESAGGLLVCSLALGRSKIVRKVHRGLAIHASRLERRKTVMRLWTQAAGGMVIARTLNHAMRTPDTEQGTLLNPLLKRSIAKLANHAREHSDRADAQYHLAVCQNASGDAQNASSSIIKALDINPRYIAAAQLFAKLESHKRTAA